MVLAVSATSTDRQAASAPVWTTISGDVPRVVLTPPFAARRVIFSTDGTLWAFDRVYDNKFEEQTEYDTLRHYDAEGKLIRSIDRASARVKSPSSESYLTMSTDRIGVLSIGDTTGLRSASHQELLLLGAEGDHLVIRVKPPRLLSWVRIQ